MSDVSLVCVKTSISLCISSFILNEYWDDGSLLRIIVKSVDIREEYA